MIDLLVLLLCAFAAYRGWRQGALLTVLPLVGVVAGYGAGLALYRPLGDRLSGITGLPALASYLAAGVAVVLAIGILFRVLAWWIRRRQADAERLQELHDALVDEPGTATERPGALSAGSRSAGAAFGAAWAFGLALVLVWGVESVAGLTGGEVPESVTGRVAGQVVGGMVGTLVRVRTGDAFAGRAAASLIRDPAGFTDLVGELTQSDAVLSFLQQDDIVELLANGRVQELAGRPELGRLLEDPAFAAAARRLGVAESVESMDPTALAESLAATLGPVSGAVRAIQEQGGLPDSLQPEELRRRLESGGLMALLGDRQFLGLLERVQKTLGDRTR